MRRTFVFLCIGLLAGCGTTTGTSIQPAPVEGAAEVLARLCAYAHRTGTDLGPMHVAPTVRKIVTADVLVALAIAMGKQTTPADFAIAEELANAIQRQYVPEQVKLPARSQCAFTVDPPTGDLPVLVEVSTPFQNPYAQHAEPGRGFVLRMSVARQARSWYFAEIEKRGGRWSVSKFVQLPLDD